MEQPTNEVITGREIFEVMVKTIREVVAVFAKDKDPNSLLNLTLETLKHPNYHPGMENITFKSLLDLILKETNDDKELQEKISDKLNSTFNHSLYELQKLTKDSSLIPTIQAEQKQIIEARQAIIDIRTAILVACKKYKENAPDSQTGLDRLDKVIRSAKELENKEESVFPPSMVIKKIQTELNKGYAPLSINKRFGHSLWNFVDNECKSMFNTNFENWINLNTSSLQKYPSVKELFEPTEIEKKLLPSDNKEELQEKPPETREQETRSPTNLALRRVWGERREESQEESQKKPTPTPSSSLQKK